MDCEQLIEKIIDLFKKKENLSVSREDLLSLISELMTENGELHNVIDHLNSELDTAEEQIEMFREEDMYR
jgi:uncharacterized coiled-coil DUF342 family protein